MKKIILLLPVLILFSCSVQKRKYQKGFYVNWNKHSVQKEKSGPAALAQQPKQVTAAENPEPAPVTAGKTAATASADNSQNHFAVLQKPSLLRLAPDSCDEIIFRSGEDSKVKIMEITANELKYKRCDNITGPLYVCKKSDVFMVKYSNGTSETFKAELPNNNYNYNNNNNSNTNNYEKIKPRQKRIQHPLAIISMIFGILALSSGYIALILIFFAGLSYIGFAIPLVIGMVAVVTGRTALNDMKLQPDMYKGRGKAKSGFIEGLIVVGISLFLLLLFLMFAL